MPKSLLETIWVKNLHAKWFVAFLEPVGGEILEMVDVLPKGEPRLLPDAQGARGHEAVALDIVEGRFGTARVHHQLAIQRKTSKKYTRKGSQTKTTEE